MITGDIKTRIDSIWDTFWTGGITNSITILEQMTYLFFAKMLDDAQRMKEASANVKDVALRKFSTFISGNELNYEQEEFLSTIVNYVCENGDITKDIVVNEEPFCDQNACFLEYMLPLANYIDNIHTVILPLHYTTAHDDTYLAAAEETVSYG